MNKFGVLAFAAQFAPRLFQVRRGTWIAAGAGVLVLFGLFVWAAMALLGWLLGQGQSWMGAAPAAARGALAQVEQVVPGALAQVEQAVPGALGTLGGLVPALNPAAQPQRDVSGSDLGPVARYPDLARIRWQQEGGQVAVEYEGQADYAAVLDHYAQGFAARGFTQTVQSATKVTEMHEYTKGRERFALTLSHKPNGSVGVRIETTQQ
ncbi:MAG: hypothetical protein U0997_05130 [Sulfurimicrobium sp.]|nr:hypothetical protein [Sulfurimicrobium sp.]